MLEIVASCHCMLLQEKLMKQNLENSKLPSFKLNFGPNLGLKFFFVSFTSTAYYTLLQAIIVGYFKGN